MAQPVPGSSPESVLALAPLESIDRLLRALRTRRSGLSDREAARRLVVFGPNELVRRRGRGWLGELVAQLVHPLALLLWVAAGLAAASGTAALAIAIVIVILINALFAFLQERHAEKAVEALSAYLPLSAHVIRDDGLRPIDVRQLVPGDVIMVEEGDRVCADARLLSGSVEMDVSTLTGESLPALREADPFDTHGPLLEARDVVFSGTNCTQGEATAVVFNTGMHTELGRIAALSQRVGHDESPLEKQVKHVARLIAVVAVVMGVAFIPLGTLVAGLSLSNALNFAIGLLVANVPEGLLPTITLALAVGVRILARKGVLVKRISAVETLGSTSVICTDKTGTLTLNRMRVVRSWTSGQVLDLRAPVAEVEPDRAVIAMALAAVRCNNARIQPDQPDNEMGDPTELALLHMAISLGIDLPTSSVERIAQFHFDPALRRMSTLDRSGGQVRVHTKGAPEELLSLCARIATRGGQERPLTRAHAVDLYLEALSPLGVEADGAGLDLKITDGMQAQAAPVLPAGRIAGMAPGSRWATKRWPARRFAELTVALRERGYSPLLLGGPGDAEAFAAVRAGLDFTVGDTAALDVGGLAAAVAHCALVVSGDTGPAHLAWALQVPQVVLFGPTSPERWRPMSQCAEVVRLPLWCSPCSNYGTETCPEGHHGCMVQLGVEPVLEAADRVAGPR